MSETQSSERYAIRTVHKGIREDRKETNRTDPSLLPVSLTSHLTSLTLLFGGISVASDTEEKWGRDTTVRSFSSHSFMVIMSCLFPSSLVSSLSTLHLPTVDS